MTTRNARLDSRRAFDIAVRDAALVLLKSVSGVRPIDVHTAMCNQDSVALVGAALSRLVEAKVLCRTVPDAYYALPVKSAVINRTPRHPLRREIMPAILDDDEDAAANNWIFNKKEEAERAEIMWRERMAGQRWDIRRRET